MSLLEALEKGLIVKIGSDLSGLKSGVIESMDELNKLNKETAKQSQSYKALGMAVGTAATSAGIAIVALTDDAKKTNAELGSTAITLGITTEAMRELALDTSDAGFPLQEVTNTFDALSKAGVKSTDDLTSIAKAMDTLADATGNSADATTSTMIPALRAFDIPLTDVGKHSDALTYMVKNSSIGLEDFSTTMNRLAPKIQDMGLSMEDVISILMAMEQKGIRGRAALSQLTEGFSAVTDAEKAQVETNEKYAEAQEKLQDLQQKAAGSTKDYTDEIEAAQKEVDKYALSQGKAVNQLQVFYETLPVTESEISNCDAASSELAGSTQKYADNAETAIGTMDRLKAEFDEFKLSAGSTLEPLNGIGAALAAGGPLILGLTQLPQLLTGVRLGLTLLSTHPIILVLTIVIASLVLLEMKFGLVSKAVAVLGAGFDWICTAIGDFVNWVTTAVNWSDILYDAFLILLGPIGWIQLAMDALGVSWGDVWNGMIDIMKGSVNLVIDGINSIIGGINYVNTLGGLNKNAFTIPEIPHLASGGIVTEPTVAMIGESGPEAVVPLSGGGSGIGGVRDIIITGNTFGSDAKQTARELKSLIDIELLASGVR